MMHGLANFKLELTFESLELQQT